MWPIGFAVGVACILVGLVVSTIVAVIGAVIAIAFGFLWIRDVTRPVRTPAPELEPETRSLRASTLRNEREGRNSSAMTRTETQARHESQAGR